MRVDGRNIKASEDVSVHIIDSSNVVNVCRIVKQVVRLIWHEVTIDHGRQGQVEYKRV